MDGYGDVRSARMIPPRLYHFMDALGSPQRRDPDAGYWTSAQVHSVLHWVSGARREARVLLVVVVALCTACSTMHAGTVLRVRSPRDRPPGVPGRTALVRAEARRTTITGGSLDLADEIGHGVVAVNVWASWCAPCRKEMPVLARAVGTRLRVVGIDERDSSGSARSFARSRGAPYPSLSDPEGELLARSAHASPGRCAQHALPRRHGRVAARVIGPVDARVLRRIIRQLGDSS